MKQVIIKQGAAVVATVPAPLVEAGTIIVQVDHSCISIGTEMSGIKSSGQPLWQRALKQPHNVKKALQLIATTGLANTRSVINGQLAAGTATGYSAAGTVIAVGVGVTHLQLGDRVACAGAQCAHHAEIIRVPQQLVSKIPDNVAFADASTVTLGAIALQGVRRAAPTLGETFVVIGLGILGQLTSQLLLANGCQVIGLDLDPERIALAKSLGMTHGFTADATALDSLYRLTDGFGADGVIITAATESAAVVSMAFNACRKKGRVILVGDVGLQLNRSDFYAKEIDFLISCSYGPGRYDSHYEEEGLDYPIGYVRWTENRNMSEYLRLLSTGQVKVQPLVNGIYPIDNASAAYGTLTEEKRPLMVLLHYPQENSAAATTTIHHHHQANVDKINVAIVGAGGFAKAVHLPNLKKLADDYHLRAIVSRTGHNANATARQFNANYATSDFNQVLADHEVNAVIITTRHDLHASNVLAALQSGKHVLVEKPLVLTRDELTRIQQFYEKTCNPPLLQTGFNRRFSPHAQRINQLLQHRTNPMIINYRMNAGYLPHDHWVHGPQGGGRNLGEACHIYDLLTFFTKSKVVTIHAAAITPSTKHYRPEDNFSVLLTFADGSVANVTYTALGHGDFPKEQMEIFCDGNVFALNNYQQLTVTGIKKQDLTSRRPAKGHPEELMAFAHTLKQGGDWALPLWQQIQATEIAFAVEQQLTGITSCAEL